MPNAGRKGGKQSKRHIRGAFTALPRHKVHKNAFKRVSKKNEKELRAEERENRGKDGVQLLHEQVARRATPEMIAEVKKELHAEEPDAVKLAGEAAEKLESKDEFIKALGKKKGKLFNRLLAESEAAWKKAAAGETISTLNKAPFEKSDKSVKDLLKLNIGTDVDFAQEHVFTELELRNLFPGQGCECKFFSSGKFFFAFVLSKNGVPVAQIRRRKESSFLRKKKVY